MLENSLASASRPKGKERSVGEEGEEDEVEEMRKMAVTALVAMIEIWMSDLWYVSAVVSVRSERLMGSFEPAAESNCDALITRAMSISPEDVDVRISLASIRMSQQRFDEAKQVAVKLFEEIDEKEPCKGMILERVRRTR
jgi:hypothetical protein